ncbi:MAG: glycine cleavage system aminomethyltransferase GcvT [Bacteroidetes bacterium]|nr:glycine cleavage system aminomethyltransferase GcvT [Bacteroidota bacterium]
MKRTPLYHKHIALGAKMVPFAGFEMPVSYSGIKEEHRAVREQIGMFDVSHMGEFLVKGPSALPFINYATSNDASKLSAGKAQYSCMPNHDGGIVDDLLVYMIGENDYMLVVNGACLEKDWNWLSEINKKFGADFTDVSDNIALMAVQGPKAMQALQKLTPVHLADIPFYQFRIGTFAGIQNITISNTGYTGAGGFEIYVPVQVAAEVWDAIMEAGKGFGLMPTGLGCRDTLRLEMGYCLYGNDITDTTSPLEAGLGWITKLDKVGGFVGMEHLKNQKGQGLKRKLVALEMVDKAIPRHDYPLCDAEGNQVGFVTSGTHSPSLDKAIALGYVPTQMATEGHEVFVGVRNKLTKAVVVKLPFFKQQ